VRRTSDILKLNMSSRLKTSTLFTNVLQFLKLQLAGNILFLGTIMGIAVADTLENGDPFIGLVVGSALAHVVFFYVNKNWIFTGNDNEQTKKEAGRFILFMSFNFVLNIFLVEGATSLIATFAPHLGAYAYYIGVVMAAMFFAIWSYLGLKLWVFKRATNRHATVSRYHGLTYEKQRGKK